MLPIAVIMNAIKSSWTNILYISGTPFPVAPIDVTVSTLARDIFSDSYNWSAICCCYCCCSFSFCAYVIELPLIRDTKDIILGNNSNHLIEEYPRIKFCFDLIGLTMIFATNSFGFIT
jgi:hypothetical protein